ncbi:MAG: MFS transporter [Pseudomonadales bacterium]|nr:MFS transporter [Pseudomonadales bacterium]NRA17026.1 MFS transporter [Oceanospirillaceae bacterium]
MLVGNFFVRGTYFMVWPFLAVILYEKFGLSATEVGMILSTAAGFSVLIGMYVGNLSDRKGRKPFMLAATVIGVIAFTLLVLLLYYLTKYLKRPNFGNLPSTQAASQ